jgi:hypothetical protein
MRNVRLELMMTALVMPLLTIAADAQSGAGPHHAVSAARPSPGLVDRVRDATDVFRDVNQTPSGGYFPFLGCVSGPQEGAMGVHFVNMDLVNDLGKIEANRPEALIYEPRNGEFRLVGVEYIVTVAAWKNNNPPEIGNFAPVLDGQTFHFVDSPNRYGLDPFYELHVWAWQHNPHGAFVDWNTLVSCEGQ